MPIFNLTAYTRTTEGFIIDVVISFSRFKIVRNYNEKHPAVDGLSSLRICLYVIISLYNAT